MRCFVVAGFLLTSALRGPSAIAEPLVIVKFNSLSLLGPSKQVTNAHVGRGRHVAVAVLFVVNPNMCLLSSDLLKK